MTTKELIHQVSPRYGKIRKRGAEIVRSLLSEGYVLVSQSNACETVTLKHTQNGNRMTIRCGYFGVWLYKNGRLCKIEML